MKQVIDYINSLLCLKYNEENIYGLVEIVRKTTEANKFDLFPASYSDSEYKKIESGIYHRLIQPYRQTLDPDSGCSNQLFLRQYSMRLVAIIDKSKLLNDAYQDQLISEQLTGFIEFRNNKQLSVLINADSVYTEINRVNLSREDVFKSEFSGQNFVPYNRTLISIDYTIFINGNKACLDQCSSL